MRIGIRASGALSLSECNISAYLQKLWGNMLDQQHFPTLTACLAESRKHTSRETRHTRQGKTAEVPVKGLADFRGNAD